MPVAARPRTVRKSRSAEARTNDALSANVKATLATAVQVLDHFQQSLHRSGFAEGVAAYEKMADTLAGQKMWSASHGVNTDAEFATIASLALSIHEMLAPYDSTMRRLSTLGGPAQPNASVAAATSDPPAHPLRAAILQLLEGSRLPMSVTALRTQCRCDKGALAVELASLERTGRVKRLERSGRTLYSLGSTSGAKDR